MKRKKREIAERRLQATQDELSSIDHVFANCEKEDGIKFVPYESFRKLRDLGAGADADRPGNRGQTPLHHAAAAGHPEVAQLLLLRWLRLLGELLQRLEIACRNTASDCDRKSQKANAS